MSTNKFEILFAEAATIVSNNLTTESEKKLKNILIKLNNPNFYNKFTKTHPMANFGYYKNKNINPMLICIKNVLATIKSNISLEQKTKKIQEEFAWSFNEYKKCYNWFNPIKEVNHIN